MASTVDRCREALSTSDVARLVALAADRSEWVRASVPLNPRSPRELLRTCLADPSCRVVAGVTARMASDARFWDEAAPLTDEVAGWLATCGALTEQWALRLAHHENVSVREPLAFSTPWLSAQAHLSRDRARDVRTSLAGSLFLLPQVRAFLLSDPGEDVRDLATRRWQSVGAHVPPDPLWVTEDELVAEALREPGFGSAAAVHRAAVVEHDRQTDAIRRHILLGQAALPWSGGAH